MTYVKCPYCPWSGPEPSSTDFETPQQFDAAVKDFYREHDEQCPGPGGTGR